MTPYFLLFIGIAIFIAGTFIANLLQDDLGTGFTMFLLIIITVFASACVYVGVSVINL